MSSFYNTPGMLPYVDDSYDQAPESTGSQRTPRKTNVWTILAMVFGSIALFLLMFFGLVSVNMVNLTNEEHVNISFLSLPFFGIAVSLAIPAVIVSVKNKAGRLKAIITTSVILVGLASNIILMLNVASHQEMVRQVNVPLNYEVDEESGVAVKYPSGTIYECAGAEPCSFEVTFLANESVLEACQTNGGTLRQSFKSNYTQLVVEATTTFPPLAPGKSSVSVLSWAGTVEGDAYVMHDFPLIECI